MVILRVKNLDIFRKKIGIIFSGIRKISKQESNLLVRKGSFPF